MENISWISSILLIIAGAIIVFAGKILLRLIIGGIFGSILGYIIVKIILFFSNDLPAAIVLGFLGFIIGFFIGWFIFKLTISIVTGFFIGLIIAFLLGLFNNIPLLILAVLLSIGISYILAEKIISLLIILSGLSILFAGLYLLTENLILSSIIVLLFTIFVAINRLHGMKREK